MTTEQVLEAIKDFDAPKIIIYRGDEWAGYSARELKVEDSVLYNCFGAIGYIERFTRITDTPPVNFNISCTLGSDPEFFFLKDGEVLPSSELVGKTGRVIQDGFQGELNPHANECRQVSGQNIGYALMDAVAIARNAGVKVSLKVGHFISDGVWKNSPKEIKKFGCSPTQNVHEQKFKRVTGLRERFRAAGGHIHIGLSEEEKNNKDKIVALMDIVVGNTCVLIDRDPDNARRRKNYGRAGEHRVKSYGLEYRVLSNFWLRHYVLWSFCSALMRNAVVLYQAGKYEELVSRFDMHKVRRAINENNYDLALENFKILRKFLEEGEYHGQGLDSRKLALVENWLTSSNPLSFCETMEQTLDSWSAVIDYVGCDGFEKTILDESDDEEDDEYDY